MSETMEEGEGWSRRGGEGRHIMYMCPADAESSINQSINQSDGKEEVRGEEDRARKKSVIHLNSSLNELG